MANQFIYSRVSTDKQTTDAQLSKLRDRFPNAKVIEEIKSGVKRRPILETLLKNLEKGDTLIVAALDRLGRKTSDVLSIIEDLEVRGIILMSDREGVDYSTPAGRLVTQILVSVAEMERNIISERTKAGLKAARERGRQIGRKPVIPVSTKDEAMRLVHNEGLSIRKAAKAVGMNHSYLATLLKQHQPGQSGQTV